MEIIPRDMERLQAQIDTLKRDSESPNTHQDLAAVYLRDAADLMKIKNLIEEDDIARAAHAIRDLDTAVRDLVPLRLLNTVYRLIERSETMAAKKKTSKKKVSKKTAKKTGRKAPAKRKAAKAGIKVAVGGVYAIKGTDNGEVPVRVDEKRKGTGWRVTNLKTGRQQLVMFAENFLREWKGEVPEPAAKKRKKRKGKLSALDAAAQVLEKVEGGMRCVELIQAMEKASLWTSPKGKTPSNTLYSAILRDLKSKTPRFKKVGPGRFAHA